MSTPDTLARRVADVLERRGNTSVTLRRITTSGPPHLLTSPPTLVAPVLDGAHSSGAASIAIRATDARGRLVAGDRLTIGGVTYRITGTVNSRTLGGPEAGFDAVPISPNLTANLADGASVVPIWSADSTISAVVQAYPQRLVDGARILARDLMVTIAAHGFTEPTMTDQLIIGSDIRTIVSMRPTYAAGQVVRWELQAR